MFEAVRNNRLIVQVILGLIVLTFAFFGIESYLGGIGNDASLATVGSTKIGPNEFETALRRQQDQIREQAGGQVDLAQLNTPAIRQAVLEGLVNQRLLALHANDVRLSVSVAQLQEVISSIDAFKENGQFSRARYEQTLRSQGLSEPAFEAQLRQDIAFQQLTIALGSSAVSAMRSAKTLLSLQIEERKLAVANISADSLGAAVEVSDAQVDEFYKANSVRFQQPARVKADYLVLDREQLAERVEVDEQAVRKWYDEHQDRYSQEEERRARHILIEVPSEAPEDRVAAAKTKAEGLLAELRKDGGKRFEELARKESQDPGSAQKGGDLGFFSRGMMVKPFEDAVFALEDGAIADVVRTDFGFHIIQVTGIHAAQTKPYDDVRPMIEAELRAQEAQKRFAELAESFSNVVYEQPDTLQPAADEFQLAIQTSDWISEQGEQAAPFSDARVLAALFSPEAITRKLNTEAFDLGDGRLLAARIREHEPRQTLALDTVRPQIVAELKLAAGKKLAAERGQEALKALRAGETVDLVFAEPVTLTRKAPNNDVDFLRQVFAASTSALPSYGGTSVADGSFRIFRLDSVNAPAIADDDPRLAALREQYERILGERDLQAFLAELRRKHGVEINRAALQATAS